MQDPNVDWIEKFLRDTKSRSKDLEVLDKAEHSTARYVHQEHKWIWNTRITKLLAYLATPKPIIYFLNLFTSLNNNNNPSNIILTIENQINWCNLYLSCFFLVMLPAGAPCYRVLQKPILN